MKKIFVLIVSALMLSLGVLAVNVEDEAYYAKFKDQKITLNVYNWGEYISDGSEDSLDIISEFEELTGINVNYTTYETNEDLYAKLSSSNSKYDIIIPSDYMIARMIDGDMLEKLDYENIPNIKFIDEKYHKTDFDPEGAYSVPYTWGTVGVIYNTKYVDKADLGSWDLLWNEKYAGKILMFSNSRDAFGVALKKLGYSLNTTDENEIKEAAEELKKQKSVVQAYVMDMVFDKMESESAHIATYYAGDCQTMMNTNPNLAFYYPKEGYNIFIDSVCIPKGAQNKEAAEAFINFLCETEVAKANSEYICYFTPQTEAAKLLEVDERIQPTDESLENSESFIALPDETNSLMDSLWIEVKSGLGTDNFSSAIIPVAIIIILGVVIFVILSVLRNNKKKKLNY